MKESFVQRLLLLRFFSALKSRQPKLFYFCLTLTVLQLLCTAAKLEATPFMLYGMFSEKYPPSATISRHQLLADGRSLASLPLHFREQLLLQATAENYLNQRQNNNIDPLQTRVEEQYSFFAKTPFYPFLAQRIYNKPQQLARYELWFKNRIRTKQPVQEMIIRKETYTVMPFSAPIKRIRLDTLRQF